MVKDLSKLPIKAKQRSGVENPKDIFKALTLRGTVQNIWEPQAEALSAWFEHHRHEPDVVIQMSTGGGKTLVGLLIAQSIVNQTRGKVLYVCPTNQLVEQVASKAAECGLAVATYMRGKWTTPQVFDTSSGPCITNYHALFNGRSIFRNRDIQAIIFDDAHVANNFVRSNFALSIAADHAAYKPIASLFRSYFAKNSQGQEFDDAIAGDWRALLFVPTFEMAQKASQLRLALTESGADKDDELGFPWIYLKDRLARCVTIISGSRIEITPPLLPVHTLPYFGKGVRRLYLTATMPSQVEFARTFGIAKPARIVPGGKSGEAQRQFLFLNGSDEDRMALTLALIEPYKACIIAPSEQDADDWCPPAARFDKSVGNAVIEAFSKSKGTDKLAFAARYDGIDLPGDACRILVLTGLPVGESLIDRFTDQTLRIDRLRAAHTTIRFVQAVGRIFRSNTDHGAVLIADSDLERWLHDPQNQRYMPGLLQRQITLGTELRRMVDEGHTNFADLLSAVLQGREDWDNLYSENVSAFEAQDTISVADWMVDFAVRERTAFEKLWDGNFGAAATLYGSAADDAMQHDSCLSAWYRHWQGLARQLNNDADAAAHAYVSAANVRAELGRPWLKGGKIEAKSDVSPGQQAQRIHEMLSKKRAQFVAKLSEVKAALVYGPKTNATEQALCDLGKVLGLESSRPDKDLGTGPDVLWRSSSHKAGAAIEAKTNKGATSQYQKKEDIGQFHDHAEWLKKTWPQEIFYKAIVGRKLAVSKDSNPLPI